MALKVFCLDLLLCCWSWTNTQSFDPQQLTRDVAAPFCPYTRFCHTEAAATFRNETGEPCCGECSCDDDCWETESCCPDQEDIIISKPTDLVCKDSMVNSILISDGPLYYFLGIKSYFIIDHCPNHAANIPLHRKCGNEDGTTVEDFVWVTDNLSGKIFQNRYCALCHRVKDWTIWKVQTTCLEILTASFSNVTDTLLFSKACDIINIAPQGLSLSPEKFRCYKPTYTSCNQTGKWHQYDQDIAEACHTYTVPFFQLDKRGLSVYKNLFCFLCNMRNDVINGADKMCPSRDDKTSPFRDVSAIVNFDPMETEHPGEFGCNMDELFDIYTNRCQKLICPIGRAPLYGRCELLASEVDWLHMRFALYLRYVPEKSTFSPEKQSEQTILFLGEQLHAEFVNSDVFSSCNISFIEVYQVDTPETSSDFIIMFALCTTDGCYLENVIDKLASAEGKEIEMFVNEQVLVFQVSLEKRSDDDFYNETIEIFVHAPMVGCSGLVEIRQRLCPAFQLECSEIIWQTNWAVRDYLLSVADDTETWDETSTIHVCVEDYFNAMAQVHVNIAVGQSELLYSILEFTITVACLPYLFAY